MKLYCEVFSVLYKQALVVGFLTSRLKCPGVWAVPRELSDVWSSFEDTVEQIQMGTCPDL